MLSIQPIEHVKAFCAEIGPRGPGTEAEARAAAYAASKLEEAGAQDVTVETFRSVPSLWWALEIGSALAVASTGIYYLSGGELWGWSVLMCLATLYIIIGELSFWRFSLSSLLSKKISQNVFARVPPKRETRKKIVVIGHLDTHRTPILFHPRLVKYLRAILIFTVACVILKALVFMHGAATEARTTALVSLILDVPIVAVLAAMLHGDFFSPYTEGANDNATGAAVVLSLTGLLARDPLEYTEYRPLCTGCEEAGLTGIKAFFDKHGEDLEDAYFIDLECLGIGQLRYITYEGMLKRYYSNPGLVRAAADTAKKLEDPTIQATALKLGYSETAVVIRNGLKGITLIAIPEGSDEVPHWHQTSDRFENIDPELLNKAVRFLAALTRELDSG